MKKSKILLCHNFYTHPGGESLVFENEKKGLINQGHPVVLYTRSNLEIENFSKAKKAGLIFSAFNSARTRHEITELVNKEKPDVAIVQNVFPLISPSIYTTLASLEIPIIQAVYNYRFVCPQGELFTKGHICERCVRGNMLNAFRYRCYRNSYLSSAWYGSILGLHRILNTINTCVGALMVPDDFLGKKLIEGGLLANKIQRNPNPFFIEDFQPCIENDGYILYVGRLVRQKGIMTLLEAVRKANEAVNLVIVGRGEAQEEVEQFIAVYNLTKRVTFLGPKWGDDVANLIRRSKAVVVPSEWYDNLPLILCQANACGKPVIASRINGIPEYMFEGENGYLFNPGNADELAVLLEKMTALSDINYQSLSKTSRKVAEDIFDYPHHYRVLSNIIESLKG